MMNKGSLFCGAALVVGAVCGGTVEVTPGGTSPHEVLAKIRAAKAGGSREAWTVKVKAGLHVLSETLVFTPADSGTPDAPVAWVGEDGAVLSGGNAIRGWRDDGGGVWSAPVPKTPSGEPAYFEQLWVDGRRAERARLPDAGYFNVRNPAIAAVTNGAAVSFRETVALTNAAAAALAAVPADELQCAQMCVVHKWSFARRVLRGVSKTADGIEVATTSPRGQTGWQKWSERETLVHFENVRSAFDAPGEWFYDAKAGRVLYRSRPGEDMARAVVVAPSSKVSRIVEFRGEPDSGAYVHDVRFENLEFAYSDAPSDANGPTESWQHQAASGFDGAVTAEGVQRLAWKNCRFRHTGNYALRFNDGCTSNRIENCLMEDLGAGGVWMGARRGYVAKGEALTRRVIGNLAPRSTAFNSIENCTIRGGGRFNPEGTGVAYTHVSDSKVVHCDIHDMFYTGVSVGWTWGFAGSVAQRNEVAFNRIYDLGKGVMSDMGGVYTLGTSFGTKVHDNVIHDVWAYSYGGWALYTDEGSEGVTMERNLCWNTTDGGFHQHYGTGCVIRNNVFAWNRKLGAVRMARQVVQGVPCTLHFVNNVVVVREGPLVGLGPRGVGGVWANNLWYDYSGKPVMDGLDWPAWAASGKETGGVYADPQFVDADKNDFRLRPSSPAFAMGFKAWDWSKAGVR